MGLTDRLNGFCYPVSKFWTRESAISDGLAIWHDEVDVTLCFEDTAILYGICGLFWAIIGIKLLLSKQTKHSLPFSWLNVTKLVLLVLPFLTALFDFFYTIHQGTLHRAANFQYLTPLVIAITMVLAAVTVWFDKQLGARSSALQFFLWLCLVVYGSLKFRTLVLIAEDEGGVREKFPFATFCIQFVVFIAEFVLSFIPERVPHSRGSYHLQEDERKPCPEEEALFFSKMTWWWLNGVIWRGWRRTLDYSDLSDINVKDYASVVAPRFQKFWNRELKKAGLLYGEEEHHEQPQHLRDQTSDGASVTVRSPGKDEGKKKKSPSLLLALFFTFGPAMALAALFKLGQDLLLFVGPQVLRLIIKFAQDPSQPSWKGYFYAILLFVAAVVQSLLLHQYFHICNRVGMNMRTVVISAVYRKSLRLSSQARKDKTVGEIVNLMSVDAQRLLELMTYIHILWSGPFQIIVSLIFLWFAIGPSIFAGFGLMLLLIPVNAVIGSFQRKLQMRQMSVKDSRIKIVNELLNGFKVIKLYAWEKPFKKNVMDLRKRELAALKKVSYFGLVSSFFWFCAPFMVTFITFATYSLANRNNPEQRLTAERVFVSLALFNILRFPMNVFPMIISVLVSASVSMKRLGEFLRSDEMNLSNVQWSDQPAKDCEDAASIKGGTFAWDTAEKPVLSDIDFAVRPGQLIAVVGQVGTGKSSLLSSLLGETRKLKGRVTLKGSVAYVPQQAWILNATVKENIVFGKPMNSVLYQEVLHACALEPDLEVLTGGDMTEIGEKGINLSGGQKLRVSLARAVYQDTDIYLMDDPLSAVDAHVGRHLFDKVLGPDGILHNKVRILVTHNVTYLTQCDHIVVLDDGKIAEEGAYSQLIENNGAFAEFLRTYSNIEESDDTKNSDTKEVKDEKLAIRKPKAKKDDSAPNAQRASLIVEEKTQTGRVKFSVVLSYVKACTYTLSLLTVLFYALRNGTQVGANFWLAHWSNIEDSSNSTTNVGYFLGIYTLFGFGQAIAVVLASVVLIVASMIGAQTLHNRMLVNIIRSPMSFFDITPTGRILNRFSKDIYTIDETIPRSFSMFFGSTFTVISVIIVIIVATPVFAAVILPLGVLYMLIQRFYVAASRQLKRLESVTRSPIYSHFQESITGASSIRAYRQQERFIQENMTRVDSTNVAYYPSVTINRWLAIRLEFIGTLIVFFSALFAAIQRNYSESFNLGVNAGLIGLSISYALQVTNSLNWIVRQTSELETNIIAVERTKEYSETPTEAPAIIESHRPPRNWPSEGFIQFHHYSTRYRENLDLVLRDLNFKITGRTKVGLVGRTGAGKSSMTLALFRIIEAASGTIVVDGVDISTIGLEDLRSKLTIIPQDPVLFTGTLRTNLDPFKIYTDDELWRALETSHLSTFVSTLEEGLEHTISEGGENLSVGQRQLVCLARALLRKSKILVLDEATAAVDLETDDLIQRTIRSEFSDCTVITIAHRINTIMDYDYVMVLQGGEILEYDTPRGLLSQKGQFYSLAKEAGLVS